MANPWEIYSSQESSAPAPMPWEQFGGQGTTTSPVVPQVPQEEKGFFESLGIGLKQSSLGSGKLYAEMLKLKDFKEGTPAYNKKLAEITSLAQQEQQEAAGTGTIGHTLGSVIGGIPYGLSVLGESDLAETARQLGRGVPMEKAKEAGTMSSLANALSLGVGGGATRLGTAVKQGAAGGIAGQVSPIATTGQIDPTQLGTDFLLSGILGGALHQHVPTKPQELSPTAHPAEVFAQQQQQPHGGSLVSPEQLAQQQLLQDIAARSKETWQQPELFGSHTTTEHIGMQRQLDQMGESGQMPFDFETPNEIRSNYELAQTPDNALRSNMPMAAEQPPLEFTKTGEQNYQAPYKQTYGMEPLQDDLFNKTPVGNALTEEQKKLTGPSGRPIDSSPLDVVGAKETHPLANANIDDLISTVREQNGGMVPDIKGDVFKNVMSTANWLRTENNPILTSVISKIDRMKADLKNITRGAWYGEEMSGGRPKFGNTGAAQFFKLSKREQEELLNTVKPYWKADSDIPLEGLNLSDRQKAAWNGLQTAFNDSLTMTNKLRESLGKEPIQARKNYVPFMREGNFFVSASKNGQIAHLEGFKTRREAMQAAKELQAHGLESPTVLPRSEMSINPNKEIKGTDTFARHQQALGAARAMESTDVPGYMGHRNAMDMADAIRKYFDQSEHNIVGLGLQQIDREINGKLPPKMYAKVMEYMDKASGLGFMHESSTMRDIENAIIKHSGGLFSPRDAATGLTRAYSLFKVQWSPLQTIQTLTDPLVMAMPHIFSLEKQGVQPLSMMSELSKNLFRLAQGGLTEHESKLMSRALRSGYLENVKSLGMLQEDLSRNPSKLREYMKDPFFASKIDAVNREAYFLSAYTYAKRHMRMDSDDAFHQAGRWVKEAYVGMAPEDKAAWISKTGMASPILGSLSTWNTGMASQFAYLTKLAMKGENGKKWALPIVSALTAGILLGGLRGMGTTENMQTLVEFWNTLFPEKGVQGPQDFLLELGEKYPKMQTLINGIPAQASGLDISSRFGTPSMLNMAPAVSALLGGRAPAPLGAVEKAGSALIDLGKEAVDKKTLAPHEREAAYKALLPKFAERYPTDKNITNNKGELLTRLSPAEEYLSKAMASPTMNEAKARSVEATLKIKNTQLTALATKANDNLANSLLYGDRAKVQKALQKWTEVNQELAKVGMVKSIDEPLMQVLQKAQASATTPEQRDALKMNISNLLLRAQYGKE